jgi:hypothetical protein
MLYGRLGDVVGPVWDTVAVGVTALAVVPLMLVSRRDLHDPGE